MFHVYAYHNVDWTQILRRYIQALTWNVFGSFSKIIITVTYFHTLTRCLYIMLHVYAFHNVDWTQILRRYIQAITWNVFGIFSTIIITVTYLSFGVT